MKKSFNNYRKLLEEEKKLLQIVDETNIKIKNQFTFDFQAGSLFSFLKGFIPLKNKDKKKHDSSCGNDNQSSELTELGLDLLYESLSLLIINKTQKKQNIKSESDNSIQLAVKAVTDYFYHQNKKSIVDYISKLIDELQNSKEDK